MSIGEWVKSNIEYGRDLVGSGLEGASSVGKEALEDERVSSELARATRESWKPAALGALVGAVSAVLLDDSKPTRSALVGGIVGGVLGYTGGVAWGSRRFTGAVAKGAAKNINTVRDARWLARNPITYA